jgi:hypothetical protein
MVMSINLEKYAAEIIKGLFALIIGLVVYIYIDKTTGQDAQMNNMYAMLCERNARMELKIDDITDRLHNQNITLLVVVEILKKDNPGIEVDIDWRKEFVPPVRRGVSSRVDTSQK